ncbi:helix-turn-helix domain-containing protein [Chengkuizengella sp. SCS-71B]|uniref:helix-turn-helix domain-containing protein n=1 Tax=Chengkuizengella sp. SCS-71B TaxID=3115290 RepID=UPI0032C21A17
MESNEGYGEFIQKHRELSGYGSQRKLAIKSGISSATLSRIEKEIQRPTMNTLRTLSEYLKSTSYSELLEASGYLEGLEGEELNIVKDFFIKHNELDKLLNITINQLLSLGEFDQIKRIFNKYLSEELFEYEEKRKLAENNIMEFMDFTDPVEKTKENLLEEFNAIILSHKNSDSFKNEREFLDEISLSNEELIKKYKLTIDDHVLSEDEIKTMIALFRALKQKD